MATSQMSGVIQHLCRVLRDGAGLTDQQLLEDYISRRDEAAFAALVQRHGPMVWGVCRRVLRNHNDAEDAFQAIFLVLVRRAASIASRELLANWLYGVAHQTALKARATAAKRKGRERQVTDMPEPAVIQPDQWRDLQPVLDEELSRLPDKYRGVIVLCDLEGKTRKEAAGQLGCPEGTVASRLVRARIMLAKRLTQRGVALSAGALAAVLAQEAAASVPTSVMSSAIKAVTSVAAGQVAATGLISARVVALTEGVVKAMLLTKLNTVSVVLFVVLGVVAYGGLIEHQRATGQQVGAKANPPKQAALVRAKEDEKEAAKDKVNLPRGPAPTQALVKLSSDQVQVRIAGPANMKVCVLQQEGQTEKGVAVEVPGRLNLGQGHIAQLKLAEIPNRPGLELFPTIEIPKTNATTSPFVTTCAIPVEFVDTDFDRLAKDMLIVKIVYLSHNQKQSPIPPPGKAVTIASYDYPGQDLIKEAKQNGTVLAVVRMEKLANRQAAPPLNETDAPKKEVSLGKQELKKRVVLVGVIEKLDTKDPSLAVLSIGSDGGLAVGTTLEVFRLKPDARYLGKIRIVSVSPQKSVGKLLIDVGMPDAPVLQVGDQVASDLPRRGEAKQKPVKEQAAQLEQESLLKAQRERIVIEQQKMTQVVEDNVGKASRMYRDDPEKALALLRSTLLQIWDHPDLGDSLRRTLVTRIIAGRQKVTNGE